MKTLSLEQMENVHGGNFGAFLSGVGCGYGLATAGTGIGLAIVIISCGSFFM